MTAPGNGPRASPLLEISGLCHSFGGLKAVSDFDLSVNPNAIWGIIGPNGAGKTTVFNLITGVYRPDQGRVSLRNEDITGQPPHRIVARGIARTFQNIRLFKSMTVLDNVRTAGYCRLQYRLWDAMIRAKAFEQQEQEVRDASMAILEKFGLAGRANELAAGLPYGMQRKTELARALVSKPRLLLLDEPGAGMNPAELDQLAELVLWVRHEFGVAIVLIEHRMRLVMKLCQQVKVLNFGRTIFEGKPDDLAQNETVVKAYLGEGDAASFH